MAKNNCSLEAADSQRLCMERPLPHSSLVAEASGRDCMLCPLCMRSRPTSSFALAGPLVEMRAPDGSVTHGRARGRKAQKPEVKYVRYDPNDTADTGQLQPIAARCLMKVLYAARMCRFDLLRAVCVLAQRITRWDAVCDRRLHRLMSHIRSTLGYSLVGWVGGTADDMLPHIYMDAECGDPAQHHWRVSLHP